MERQLRYFVFAHWADSRAVAMVAGEPCGSGYTVVAATRESLARELCFQYQIDKGLSYHVSRAGLELKDNDEVSFIIADLPEPTEGGVVAEFALSGEDWSAEPVLVYARSPGYSHIEYDGAGHENEFVVVVGQFDERFIPEWFCDELAKRLGDYHVENRGTRFEIRHRKACDAHLAQAPKQEQEQERIKAVRLACCEVFGPVFAETVKVLVRGRLSPHC